MLSTLGEEFKKFQRLKRTSEGNSPRKQFLARFQGPSLLPLRLFPIISRKGCNALTPPPSPPVALYTHRTFTTRTVHSRSGDASALKVRQTRRTAGHVRAFPRVENLAFVRRFDAKREPRGGPGGFLRRFSNRD